MYRDKLSVYNFNKEFYLENIFYLLGQAIKSKKLQKKIHFTLKFNNITS